MAAPPFRAVGAPTATAAPALALTLPKPAGVVAGDCMLAWLQDNANTNTLDPSTPPAGWQKLEGIIPALLGDAWIYWKIAGASEPASYTWSGFQVNGFKLGAIIAYSGCDQAKPIDVHASTADAPTGSPSAHDTPVVTPNGAVRTAVSFFGKNGTGAVAESWTSTKTERADFQELNERNTFAIYEETLAVATPLHHTATNTANNATNNARDANTAIVILQEPQGAPPPPPPPPPPPGGGIPTERIALYKVEIAWSQFLKGTLVLDTSLLGSATDLLAGATYNSSFGGPYDDITNRSDNNVRVKTIQWTRGRSDDFATQQALAATIVCSDPNGMMNAHNPASPLNVGDVMNGALRPLRPVRVSAFFNGLWWPILFGFVRTIDYQPDGKKGTANIEITDLFAFLETPRQDQPGAAPYPTIAYTTVDAQGAQITTGGAIGLLLDWIGWSDPLLRKLDVGDTIPFFEALGDKTALQQIQDLLRPNLGTFYIDNTGAAVYEARTTKLKGDVKADFTDIMQALGSGIAIDNVKNMWTVIAQLRTGPGALTDGPPQVTTDQPSADEFGQRSDTLSSPYFLSDTQAMALSQYLVGVTKDPATPLWQLAVSNREPQLMQSMLTLDLHDRVTASESETGTTGEFFIEQLSGQIDAQGHHHQMSYILSDLEANIAAFVVGVDEIGGTKVLPF